MSGAGKDGYLTSPTRSLLINTKTQYLAWVDKSPYLRPVSHVLNI